MSAAQLLKRLSSAPSHELAALAAYFAVSPNKVTSWLENLSDQGIAVTCEAQCVALKTPIDWLCWDKVQQQSHHFFNLEITLETESTNSDLLLRSASECIHGIALACEHQRAGRGRLGRVWQSPIAQTIALSVGWNFSGGVAGLEGLSLAVGASLAEAVERDFGVSLGLKWPNDLYLNDNKCGGILIDITGDVSRACTVIVGVGLNVALTPEAGKDIDQPWAALSSSLRDEVSRSRVLGTCLNAIAKVLSSFETQGFEHWRRLFGQRDYLLGKAVVIERSVPVSGVAAGVDGQGALLVRSPSGLVSVYAGEARLTRPSSTARGGVLVAPGLGEGEAC